MINGSLVWVTHRVNVKASIWWHAVLHVSMWLTAEQSLGTGVRCPQMRALRLTCSLGVCSCLCCRSVWKSHRVHWEKKDCGLFECRMVISQKPSQICDTNIAVIKYHLSSKEMREPWAISDILINHHSENNFDSAQVRCRYLKIGFPSL